MSIDSSAETDVTTQNEVVCLAPNGLGYGEGSISTKSQIESGELSSDALRIGAEIITHDTELFHAVDVDAHDDGCGDGRPADRVFCRNVETGDETEFKKSRCRSKLFGGGLVVAASMWRTITGKPRQSDTVLGDRTLVADKLKLKGIEYGAHTDNHAKGENCGCGAIDKYPQITVNAIVFRKEIEGTLRALYGDAYDDNESAIQLAFATYEQLAESEQYFSDAAGTKTMNLILDREAIIKELSGNHKEDFVVLNDVEGTTFDQRKFDEKLSDNNIGSAQTFVVDIWRGRMYADAIAEIANEVDENERNIDELRKIAYADFLIRTLAVSSTLTAGDLTVFARKRVGQSNFALTA